MTKRKPTYEQDRALAHGREVARSNQRRRMTAKREREKEAEERERFLREHLHGWKNWAYDFEGKTESRICRHCGLREERKLRL